MSHIANTNYAFCAGLKDTNPPDMPSPADTDKDAVVKFLSNSFDYYSAVIRTLTDEQLNKCHDSPDGRLLGREILLAMYLHVGHHRGQAEIYLRDKASNRRHTCSEPTLLASVEHYARRLTQKEILGFLG
jgi:uncharacterized damage-inducible protein DinB